MHTQLDHAVLAALEAKRGQWREIAAATNVSYSWLSKFANGRIPNPGYATLLRLHQHLCPSRRRTTA